MITEIVKNLKQDEHSVLDKKDGNKVYVPPLKKDTEENQNIAFQAIIEAVKSIAGNDKDFVLVKLFWPDGSWGSIAALDGDLKI
jgi:hypothetical protein